jgi:hypothetical protein
VFDWEVKEEALNGWDKTLQFVLHIYGNIDSVDEFVQMVKPFHLIEALNICLNDYDRRFLHKTYVILQKLHNHLAVKFSAEVLRHLCGDHCIKQTNIIDSSTHNEIMSHNTHENSLVLGSEKLEVREEVISKILNEDKYSLMAQTFKENGANPVRQTYQDENHVTKNERGNIKHLERSIFKTKQLKQCCILEFLHRVRFDIHFNIRLKDFDEYCEERNSLDSVLDDIIHSVGDGNVIDGIDCF